MASARMFTLGPRALLAGDAGLLTAAAASFVLEPSALGDSRPVFLGFIALPFQLALVGLLLLPLLAWWLHGRRVDGGATVGAILGFVVGGLVVFGVMALGVAVRAVFGLSGTGVPLVVVVATAVLVAAYLIAMALLDLDALRDLATGRRSHVPLDVLRLLATVAYVVVVAAVLVWALGSPAPETDRVPILVFLWGPGAMGVAAVAVADLMVRRHERRTDAHLIAGS